MIAPPLLGQFKHDFLGRWDRVSEVLLTMLSHRGSSTAVNSHRRFHSVRHGHDLTAGVLSVNAMLQQPSEFGANWEKAQAAAIRSGVDGLAEREGFEPSVQVLARTTV